VSESFEEKYRRKQRERAEKREATKLSARTLTAVVFGLTTLYWVWALVRPNPPAISLLAQCWTGVAMFCPLISLVLCAILIFGCLRSDPTSEVWAYLAILLTFSMWFFYLARPHETTPPGWGIP
jgi:hypothetical protein